MFVYIIIFNFYFSYVQLYYYHQNIFPSIGDDVTLLFYKQIMNIYLSSFKYFYFRPYIFKR